jgi:cytochrome c oxidase assembly protein subunit 15
MYSTQPSGTASGAATEHRAVSTGLRRFAWFVLAYNVLVVLWGAVVRATGSGAGCGAHWPLCNGVVIPQAPQFHTIVEFTHRLMSGATLLLVFALMLWAWRATAKGALARWFAGASMLLTLNEALLGALLVLLRLVAHNPSAARGIYLGFHFANTLLLLAALALTAEFLTAPAARASIALRPGSLRIVVPGLLAALVTGITGSLAALGDTLYPASSLAAAMHQDFSATSSLLLRLRWMHPACALLTGIFLLWLFAQTLPAFAPHAQRTLALAVLVLLVAQYILGTVNVLLLAPLWIQITHLLLADLLWIALVLLAARYSQTQHFA